MADNSLDILIRILTEQVGTEKAHEIIKRVRQETEKATIATKESGKAADEAEIKHRDLHKTAHLLSHEFSGLGRILQFVFNPGILGAAALAAAVGKVTDAFGEFMRGIVATAANAATGIGNIKQAMIDLEIERAKADVQFKASMDDFERDAKRKIELINLEKETVLTLLDARQKADLAAAKTPAETDEINRRYGRTRQGVNEKSTREEIAAREQELLGLGATEDRKRREALKASGGRSHEATDLALKKLPDELKSLDDQIAKQEAANQQMSGITTFWGALPYWQDGPNYLAQLQAYGGSLRTLAALKRTRAKLAGQTLPLTKAAAAFTEAEGLHERVRGGLQDLDSLKSDTDVRNQTAWESDAIGSGRGPQAGMLLDAAAGADAIRGGGRASPDQARAINQATAALGLQGQNSKMILGILSKLNDDVKFLNSGLKMLESRVNNHSQRM